MTNHTARDCRAPQWKIDRFMMEESQGSRDPHWYLDSGCTQHMTSFELYAALSNQGTPVTEAGRISLDCQAPEGSFVKS